MKGNLLAVPVSHLILAAIIIGIDLAVFPGSPHGYPIVASVLLAAAGLALFIRQAWAWLIAIGIHGLFGAAEVFVLAFLFLHVLANSARLGFAGITMTGLVYFIILPSALFSLAALRHLRINIDAYEVGGNMRLDRMLMIVRGVSNLCAIVAVGCLPLPPLWIVLALFGN